MMAVLLAAAAVASPSAIERDFNVCATAYRASITGKDTTPSAFGCAADIGGASDATTTPDIAAAFRAAAQAGLRYVDRLVAEATRPGGASLKRADLLALAEARSRYRIVQCRIYETLTGGTIDRINAASCVAQDVDEQIGDLLALMKEDGIISSGR